MALGRCLVCDKLVTIVPKGYKFESSLTSRLMNWYPISHDGLDGKRCPGEKRAL